MRKILHLDLDAFFCSVEELHHPELRGTPFAVGGKPGQRGVISSCSYAARQFGVRSAMPTSRALRICPQLRLVSSGYGLYSEASQQVMAVLHDLAPLVEQISIDEAFLDVSDLPDTGLVIARRLQMRVLNETGLPCSIGVSTNKLVAKIATDAGKSRHTAPTPPRAITVVPAGEEETFLAPLPAQALWGIGPKTADRLADIGVYAIGEIAALGETALVGLFGKNGIDLAQRARGIDTSPVLTAHTIKSISQEITFEHDVADAEVLRRTIRRLAEQVGFRLRKSGYCAGLVRLKLRWPDFSTHTRQRSLSPSADEDSIISSSALELMDRLWQPGRAVRLLGVGVGGLVQTAHQLSLWESKNDREHRLLQAVDELKQRYGKGVIHRGRV